MNVKGPVRNFLTLALHKCVLSIIMMTSVLDYRHCNRKSVIICDRNAASLSCFILFRPAKRIFVLNAYDQSFSNCM